MDEFTQKLRQWQIGAPSAGLEDRLWHEITALPQQRPFGLRLREATERLFANWQYALAYKAAGLAFCALFGFYLGLQHSTPVAMIATDQDGMEIADLALARGNWMEDL